MTATPIRINFPMSARANLSDSKLYSNASVACMDQLGHDYILELTVRAADPDQERLLADTCTRAINASRQVASAMQLALQLLESVDHLSVEGDTDNAKAVLTNALHALDAPLSLQWTGPELKRAKRTQATLNQLEVGDFLELDFGSESGFATIEHIVEGALLITLECRSGANYFKISGTRSQAVTKVA
ncbi:hypothetical protein ACI77O_12835 [Pseudomonas tritici]|uniref:hypothetical protein n=1 Tax=Pseudomonas tritici TaxID=2745518 RepID=UPI00387B8C2E